MTTHGDAVKLRRKSHVNEKKAGRQGGGSLQSARLYAARLATSGPRLQGGGVTGECLHTKLDGGHSENIHPSPHFDGFANLPPIDSLHRDELIEEFAQHRPPSRLDDRRAVSCDPYLP